jgi:hypothetical protein
MWSPNKMERIFFLFLTITEFYVMTATTTNMSCMVKQCANEWKNCNNDMICKEALKHRIDCKSSSENCSCSHSGKMDIFDTLIKCIDLKCSELPLREKMCKGPNKVATSFDAGYIYGTWFIVRGKNPTLDCFDCQNITFYAGHHNFFFAVESYDVKTINENNSYRTVNYSVTQWNTTTPGILRFSNYQDGRSTTLEWQVLDFGDDFIFAYYCGIISGNEAFEGSIVYSRSQLLSTQDTAKIDKIANMTGLDFNSYCKPSYRSCHF